MLSWVPVCLPFSAETFQLCPCIIPHSVQAINSTDPVIVVERTFSLAHCVNSMFLYWTMQLASAKRGQFFNPGIFFLDFTDQSFGVKSEIRWAMVFLFHELPQYMCRPSSIVAEKESFLIINVNGPGSSILTGCLARALLSNVIK